MTAKVTGLYRAEPTTTPTTVYKNPNTATSVGLGFKIMNTTGGAITLTAHLKPVGEELADSQRVLADFSVAANTTSPVELFVDQPLPVPGNRELVLTGSAAGLVCNVVTIS